MMLSLLFSLLFCYTSIHTLEEKPIAVIIPSYNNASCYQANLDSVLYQNYNNFHIYYIADCCTDETGRLVLEYIKQRGLEDKITFIDNTYNRKALANIYRIVHQLSDDTICLIFDGDDSLANDDILSLHNKIYATEDVWLTYGQYINVPEEMAIAAGIPVLGYARETPKEVIENCSYRKPGIWYWSGLRSFYAWLFKAIKLQDLFLPEKPAKGKFFPTSYDNAIMWPMLEMAGYRIKFIEDIVLLRNVDTPLNDFKINRDLQKLCAATLRKIASYPRLEKPLVRNHNYAVDLLIIAHNSTADSQRLLDSLAYQGMQFATIYLVTDHNDDWDSLATQYPNLRIINGMGNDLVAPLLSALAKKSRYMLITDDSQQMSSPLDLTLCAQYLNVTHAYAFYTTVTLDSFGGVTTSRALMPCEELHDPVYCWKFNCQDALQSTVQNSSMTLYQTDTLRYALGGTSATTTTHDLAQLWCSVPIPAEAVGLFFTQ